MAISVDGSHRCGQARAVAPGLPRIGAAGRRGRIGAVAGRLAQAAWAGLLTALIGAAAAHLAALVPVYAGYETFVVHSASMAPALRVGDVIVVAPAWPNELMVGDIVAYRTAEHPDAVVTHRLVAVELAERGALVLLLQGDANDAPERVTAAPDVALGRMAYAVPMVGYLLAFAGRPEGRAALVCILLAGLAGRVLLARRRSRRDRVQAAAEADVLVRRGRVALAMGSRRVARTLFERAIAADHSCTEAWLLAAACLRRPDERLARVRAGLATNPTCEDLRDAVTHGVASERAG